MVLKKLSTPSPKALKGENLIYAGMLAYTLPNKPEITTTGITKYFNAFINSSTPN
jgi:hypothetical protein